MDAGIHKKGKQPGRVALSPRTSLRTGILNVDREAKTSTPAKTRWSTLRNGSSTSTLFPTRLAMTCNGCA